MENARSHVKALTFDVFGTVVDWYSSIVAEGKEFGDTHGIDIDWAQFALKWRAGYGPAMNRVRQGELPWQNIDALHRLILDSLLDEFKIEGLSEADKDHLNRVLASTQTVARCSQWLATTPHAVYHRYAL